MIYNRLFWDVSKLCGWHIICMSKDNIRKLRKCEQRTLIQYYGQFLMMLQLISEDLLWTFFPVFPFIFESNMLRIFLREDIDLRLKAYAYMRFSFQCWFCVLVDFSIHFEFWFIFLFAYKLECVTVWVLQKLVFNVRLIGPLMQVFTILWILAPLALSLSLSFSLFSSTHYINVFVPFFPHVQSPSLVFMISVWCKIYTYSTFDFPETRWIKLMNATPFDGCII